MFKKKDEFFNWYSPSKQTASRMGEIIRVYKAKNVHSVCKSSSLIKALGLTEAKEIRMAFDFSEENPFVTFDPASSVPFVIFRPSEQVKSPRINSKDLVSEFAKRWDMDKRCRYYDFSVIYWQTMRGMKLYSIDLIAKEEDCAD